MPDSELKPAQKPGSYQPPKYDEIDTVLKQLKIQREPFIRREWETRKALRGQWDEVLRAIPSTYRKMLMPPDMPQLRDMVYRVSGLIRKRPIRINVHAPEPRPAAQKKAAAEEARWNGFREQMGDQHMRDPIDMSIDDQVKYGEGWLGVWPDPRKMDHPGLKRGDGEKAAAYNKRYQDLMASLGIPMSMPDFDPATVYEARNDDDSCAFAIIESEHAEYEIDVGMGYKAVRDKNGKTADWMKRDHTLSQPFLPRDLPGMNSARVDVDHDIGSGGPDTHNAQRPITKRIFLDPWTYQVWLDGILVEEWEHDWGYVPLFKAMGADSADRTPGYESHGLIEPALAIAKQVVYFSAIMASSGLQHGFPTPFLKNPAHGTAHPRDNEPLIRKVAFGEMNLLGPQEEIEFPYQQAQMGPDFMNYIEYLSGQVDQSTLSNFGKAVGTDIAGYAIAQIRSMQLSTLAPIYRNTERQVRSAMYFTRHLIKTGQVPEFALRGAVEEDEDGNQYRPVQACRPEDFTDYALTVNIDEGIQQDEIAERKSAIEMNQAGLWSDRRSMEHTGVEDPLQEQIEINRDRILSSPAADEIVLNMAAEIMAERREATRQEQSGPMDQAMEKAKQQYMGGGGQFQNQGSAPMNADQGGTPMNQQGGGIRNQQPGGPQEGPRERIPMNKLGQRQLPGGVEDKHQNPVNAPG